MGVRFGVGKSLGNGVFVGASTSAKTLQPLSIVIIGGLVLLIGWTAEFVQKYPALTTTMVIVLVIAFIISANRKSSRDALAAEAQAMAPLFSKFEKCVDMVNNGKTVRGRVNNAAKAVELIDEMLTYARAVQEYFPSLPDHRPTLLAFEQAYPIVAKVDKADEYDFKGSQAGVRRVLAEALHYAQKNGVTDEDLRRIEAIS